MKKRWQTVALATMALLIVSIANADWPHDIKWDQLEPPSKNAAFAYGEAMAADDFMCQETGWITDIEFYGDLFQQMNDDSLLRVTFWSDVPACPNDESHPGTILWDTTLTMASPDDPLGIGWHIVDDYQPIGNELKFKVNLPKDEWFFQEEGTIYWLGLQSPQAGFSWVRQHPDAGTWNDDAVFVDPLGAQWEHLAWADGSPTKYEGLLPEGWQSSDLCFRLTGTPIPEPSLMVLAGVALLAALRRRAR